MSPELEKYFDSLNSLFNNEGWSHLETEIVQKIQQLSELSGIKNSDELFFRKGQVEAFRGILAMPETVKLAREQAEESEDVQDL